jgi:glycosyltransferase involved in cell wall biosynthesis
VSPRVLSVVSTTADVSTELLVARHRRLVDEGWEARMLLREEARGRHPALAEDVADGRVSVHPGEWRGTSFLETRLAELQPELVHFYSAWSATRVDSDGPPGWGVVVSLRDDGQDLGVPDPQALWRAADHFLYTSRAARDRATGRGWPVERATVLAPPPPVPYRRRRRDDPAEPLRVLSSGPILWEHGLEHAVQGVSLLADRGVDVEYRILGEGEHLPAVAFARHQLGVSDRVELVHMTGTDGLAEELARTDVVLDAAVADSARQTALDSAVLAGIPFVATEREAALPDGAGIVVPRRDPEAVAEALARLARDPELARSMSPDGDRVVSDPLERHLDDLVAVYRGVLEARAA